MLANRSMPRCSVIPELGYTDIGEAIRWLGAAFAFTLRLRIADHRAQMNVGDGAVVLTKLREGEAARPASVMVRVDDVNSHHERAARAGARVIQPPADFPYGERQYSAVDLAGHHWHFSQTLADVDPLDWGGTPGAL